MTFTVPSSSGEVLSENDVKICPSAALPIEVEFIDLDLVMD